jgi:hypothetical protein
MRISFLYIIFLFFACNRKSKSDSINLDSLPDVLAFITLKIEDENGRRKVSLEDVIKTVGKPKNIVESYSRSSKKLRLSIKHGNNIVEEVFLEHPLYKSVEYTQGDALQRKEISLAKETFFIRTIIKEGQTTIDIYETIDQKEKMLNSIKL